MYDPIGIVIKLTFLFLVLFYSLSVKVGMLLISFAGTLCLKNIRTRESIRN